MSERTQPVLSRVLIARRNTDDAAEVLTSGLRVSWELNAAGSIAFTVPVNDILEAMLPDASTNLTTDLLGYWVWYEHPTAGTWGGVITSLTLADGVIEVAGQGFMILLRRRLGSVYGNIVADPVTAQSGAHLRAAIYSADTDVIGTVDPEPIPLTGDWPTQLASGPTIQFNAIREDIYDNILPKLTSDIGCELVVNADRTVRYGVNIGQQRDRLFIEGRHIVASRWTDDLWNITTAVVVTGQDAVNGATYVAAQRDAAMVARFGSLIERRDIGAVAGQSVVDAEALKIASKFAKKQAAVELRLADVDECFLDVREGDEVRVALGTSAVGNARMTVQMRALDVQTGTMTISGWGWRE